MLEECTPPLKRDSPRRIDVHVSEVGPRVRRYPLDLQPDPIDHWDAATPVRQI